jgi:hypothetical protein
MLKGIPKPILVISCIFSLVGFYLILQGLFNYIATKELMTPIFIIGVAMEALTGALVGSYIKYDVD